MARRLGIGDAQGLIQITLRNLVRMGYIGNGHPGPNGPHITCRYKCVLLLILLESLDGFNCKESC